MSRWGQALVGIALGLVCSASAIVYALSGNTMVKSMQVVYDG